MLKFRPSPTILKKAGHIFLCSHRYTMQKYGMIMVVMSLIITSAHGRSRSKEKQQSAGLPPYHHNHCPTIISIIPTTTIITVSATTTITSLSSSPYSQTYRSVFSAETFSQAIAYHYSLTFFQQF